MSRLVSIYLDRDVEKSHGINVCIGKNVGVNFQIQWRSWECNDRGYDPWMFHFRVFCYNTFLGVIPFSDTWLGKRCCSNGVYLFSV